MATDLHWSVNHETAEKQTTTEQTDCVSAEYIIFNFKTLFEPCPKMKSDYQGYTVVTLLQLKY